MPDVDPACRLVQNVNTAHCGHARLLMRIIMQYPRDSQQVGLFPTQNTHAEHQYSSLWS